MLKNGWVILAVVVSLVGASPAAAEPDSGGQAEDRFQDAEHWAGVFESPERARWQKPGTVVRLLGIEEGQQVADIGAGTGYFTVLLWSFVGSSGRVYSVDIEKSMLEYTAAREEIKHARNVEFILAEPDDPKLPADALDLILIVNTWHHIEQRPEYLSKLETALRPYGRVAIIDWVKEEIPLGPPSDHKLARDEVLEEFVAQGWELSSESIALPYQYFLSFAPPSPETD